MESNDPNGPHGAKEAGEGPLHPVVPAISNAIYDAVGVRLTELPFHPGKLLRLLRAKQQRPSPASLTPERATGGVGIETGGQALRARLPGA